MQRIDFHLRGDHISLDALLKATGLADSGGGAKHLIGEGNVQVDGQIELRRSCKLRAGQVVQLAGTRIHLKQAPEPSISPPSAEQTEPVPGKALKLAPVKSAEVAPTSGASRTKAARSPAKAKAQPGKEQGRNPSPWSRRGSTGSP